MDEILNSTQISFFFISDIFSYTQKFVYYLETSFWIFETVSEYIFKLLGVEKNLHYSNEF